MNKYVIHWFRRDLRLHDNHALNKALNKAVQSGYKVKCIFIFDSHILSQLPKEDKRVQFIYDRLKAIKIQLNDIGSDLFTYYGKPIDVWEEIAKDKKLKAVFTNHDYEPYAIQRDTAVGNLLLNNDIDFQTFKDQVIFECDEILSQKGTPYTVYSPYMKTWKTTLATNKDVLSAYHVSDQFNQFYPSKPSKFIPLSDLGFTKTKIPDLPLNLEPIDIKDYDKTRDTPALDATSKIGTALRFGTMSIRKAVKYAKEHNETFLNELIWREFFMQILYHFPHVQNKAFRPKYEEVNWRNNELEFDLWCQGKTGFPIVDAGMRQLNTTGFMHNRVRMITASFLVKDLLIDWRWGEAYFALKLMDYDLAANNGNWQWAAGTGTDAAPYFRIFNPISQQKKFDPHFNYIKKWVPEYGTRDYPTEIVNHKEARERCLKAYKTAIQKYES